MRNRKVVLVQREGYGLADKPYKVAELHSTVEFSIGDKLTKREVEQLIERPRMTVLIRPAKGENW